MPTRKTAWPHGAPCWCDCAFEAEHRGMHHAEDFYGKLFGWHIKHYEDGAFALCLKDELPVAALRTKIDDEQPTVWTTYLASDDVDATVQAVEAAGGKVVADPENLGAMGRAAHATDPTGAHFGIWQSGEQTGFGLVGEPGSVIHNSLLTRDLAASKTFYSKVFGYTYADESDADATIRLSDGSTGGTIHLATHLPDDTPPSWLVHFAVADRDSSAQIAQELDAEILMTMDGPGGPEAVLQGKHGEVFNILALPD